MGLGGIGKQVLYQLDSLSRLDIADIARANHANNLRNVASGQHGRDSVATRPSIDIDANNFLLKQSGHTLDPVANAAYHMHEWSKLGLVVNPICNGNTMPQSKQASIKDRATREKGKYEVLIARQHLQVLLTKSVQGG